jgi:alcohol dehydrogenase (cytochrome c)
MAYSPRTGLIYAPINELCTGMTSAFAPAQEGRFRLNGSFSMKLPPNRTTYSHLDAWDPVTRKRAWSMPYDYILLASVLATSGDLVFSGNPEGEFFALDARTGRKLWNFQTGAGHRGSSISYSVDGRQYVATPTGWQQTLEGPQLGVLFPGQDFRGGSTLVVFALPQAF